MRELHRNYTDIQIYKSNLIDLMLDGISQSRNWALKFVEIGKPFDALLRDVSNMLEGIAVDSALDEIQPKAMQDCAADAYRMIRTLPLPENAIEAACQLLRMRCLAMLGDQDTAAFDALQKNKAPDLPLESSDWSERVSAVVLYAWLQLTNNQGGQESRLALQKIADLRAQRGQLERAYFNNITSKPKMVMPELVALYRLAKAAECFADVATNSTPQAQDALFENLAMAAGRMQTLMPYMRQIARLLWATVKMIDPH